MNNNKVNKTIGVTYENIELLNEGEVKNLSKFINELIQDALTDRTVMKRQFGKKLYNLQLEAKQLGFTLAYSLNEDNKK